jgi:hypothetical protein
MGRHEDVMEIVKVIDGLVIPESIGELCRGEQEENDDNGNTNEKGGVHCLLSLRITKDVM